MPVTIYRITADIGSINAVGCIAIQYGKLIAVKRIRCAAAIRGYFIFNDTTPMAIRTIAAGLVRNGIGLAGILTARIQVRYHHIISARWRRGVEWPGGTRKRRVIPLDQPGSCKSADQGPGCIDGILPASTFD